MRFTQDPRRRKRREAFRPGRAPDRQDPARRAEPRAATRKGGCAGARLLFPSLLTSSLLALAEHRRGGGHPLPAGTATKCPPPRGRRHTRPPSRPAPPLDVGGAVLARERPGCQEAAGLPPAAPGWRSRQAPARQEGRQPLEPGSGARFPSIRNRVFLSFPWTLPEPGTQVHSEGEICYSVGK